MEDKIKDRLIKHYELSKRGIGGERENAKLFLDQLLKKHNLTLEDIDSEQLRDRYYPYTTIWKRKIITQVICRVTNRFEIYGYKGLKELCSKVTDCEHIQILELIDFHFENFEKEKKVFLKDLESAYIQKHRLFRDTDDDQTTKNLTAEEEMEIKRIISIYENLNNNTYTKKIS